MTSAAHAAHRVGPQAAFWLVAYAFAVTMLGTTLPTPLYPTYERLYGFGPLTETVVFATYAVGVLVALLGFGSASDTVGRRPVLLAGLTVAALSSVTFLVAGGPHAYGLSLLLVGRFLSGLSAGIFTGTATAALADFAAPGRQLRASLIAAVANIGGLGLGPLIGGLLARYAGRPLQTCFLLHLGLLVVAVVAISVIPEPVSVTRPRRVRMQELHVPAQARTVLLQAGTAGFAGFAVLGLFTAVSPTVLQLLGHNDPALTGLVVFTVFVASAAGQVASVRFPVRTSLLAGTATLIVGIAAVGMSIGMSSLSLLVAGGVVAGAGQGISFRAALGAITGASPEQHRGAVVSTFFVICYAGISLPVLGVGVGIRSWGLVPTGEIFAAIVAGLSLAAFISLARSLRAG
jgi:MFS family permease